MEGTTSIPLGWVSRIVIIAAVFFVCRWLFAPQNPSTNFSFQAVTGYRDARVWLVDRFANLLIILMVFSFLSSFIPGEAGKQFRSLMFGVVGRAINLSFRVLERALFFFGKLLLRAVGLSSILDKKK